MEQIGKYRVERLLGRGGFAAVWLCHDPDLDRRVAVKVLADIYALDPDIRRRFIQEARILSRLDDERILRVHTIDDLPDGRPYFVADYADRGTLRDRIRAWFTEGATVSARSVIDVAHRIGECLAVAHHHSVVHRDLKPTNVLYRSLPQHRRVNGADEALVLADFGIARALESARAGVLTTAAGTVPYMAPEQAQGLADIRCDLYAATVILYEMLAGRAPFEGETDLAVLLKKQRLEYDAISRHRPGLPADLDDFIARGLAPEPDHRHATAEDWLAQLDQISIPAVEVPPPRPLGQELPGTETTPASRPPVVTTSTPTTPRVEQPSDQGLPGEPPSDGPESVESVPEATPPGTSPPPTEEHPEPFWSPRRLIGGGALAAVLVAAVAVAMMRPTPEEVEPPPTQPTTADTIAPDTVTTQPPVTTTTAGEDEPRDADPEFLPGHRDLIAFFAHADEDNCTRSVDPQSGAEFEVICGGPAAPLAVAYQSWDSREAIDDHLAFHEQQADASSSRWSLSNVRQGRLISYVAPTGEAIRFWTYDSNDEGWLSGEANAADGDEAGLAQWWSSEGNRPADEPALTAEEEALVEAAAFIAGAGCVAVRAGQDDYEDTARAHLASCTVSADGFTVSIQRALSWESITDLDAYWDRLEESTGRPPQPWEIAGFPVGRSLQFLSGGNPAIAWSQDSEIYLIQAITRDGTAAQLRSWWESVRD